MTRRTLRTTLALTLAALLTAPGALAGTDLLPFDAMTDLAGWEHYSNGATSVVDGVLVTEGTSFEEWSLVRGDGTSPWWRDVHPDRGWVVEARVWIDPVTVEPCQPGAFFWIHDGRHLLHVHMAAKWIALTYPESVKAPVTLDDGFHDIRVTMLGQHVTISVDQHPIVEHELSQNGGGTETLMFGVPNVCQGQARSHWDWLAYATYAGPGGADGDEDEDGVANHEDVCPGVPDPHQEDADGDRLGDACDPCPNAYWDDSDGDGLCDDADPCPYDPENLDVDENGICDADEVEDCWCGPGGWDMPPGDCGCDGYGYDYPIDYVDPPPGDEPADPPPPGDGADTPPPTDGVGTNPPPGGDAATMGTMVNPDNADGGCAAGGVGGSLPLALTLALLVGMVLARRRERPPASP